MDQQPTSVQPSLNTSAATTEKKNKRWRWLAWIASILFLLAGFGALIDNEVALGILSLLLGFVLLPPLNRWVRQKSNDAFNRKATAFSVVALFIPFVFLLNKKTEAERVVEEQKAAIEQQKQDSIQSIAEEKKKEYEAAKKMFMNKHSFVTGEAYDSWMIVNHDSNSNADYTLKSFLLVEKRRSDSILAKKRVDSIETVRFIANRQKKERIEDLKTKAATSETSSSQSSSSREPFEYEEEYYNGHKVYTGPRGGKYIVVNGKKKYLSSMK